MANQGPLELFGWTNQGGTAKLKLSPLYKGGSFFIFRDSTIIKKGGGRMESDLGELARQKHLEPNSTVAIPFAND
jgi:hypothetical protein